MKHQHGERRVDLTLYDDFFRVGRREGQAPELQMVE